jgi:endonuclease/exonuclease/phosphatase family metal-dependent hydrolase
MARGRHSLILLGAALLGACTPAHNYTDPRSPRYAGVGVATTADDRVLRIVTFNIRFARQVDKALGVLQSQRELQNADIIALQEMDAPGVERMARGLGLSYVYYPAAVHVSGGKDFGNAILVRGAIEEDHKLILPHYSRIRHMHRVAVAATVRLAGLRVRVYTVHLEAPGDLWPSQRRDQVRAIIDDARGFSGPVVVAGDFNNRDRIGQAFEQAGYTWVSQGLARTISVFGWDHIFASGLPTRGWQSGVAPHGGASDHNPVWAELALAPEAPLAGREKPAVGPIFTELPR